MFVSYLKLTADYCTTRSKLLVAVKLGLVAVAVLVADTVMVKVPAGVPWTGTGWAGAAPQPTRASRSSKPTKIGTDQRMNRFLRFPPSPVNTIPKNGRDHMAKSGAWSRLPGRSGTKKLAELLAVTTETVMFVGPGVTEGSIKIGLNRQADAVGSPLQLNVIAPSVGSGASTLMTMLALPPGLALVLLDCGVSTIGGPRLIGSVAVLLLGLTSPPPETLAVLVKLFRIFWGIFTVRVMGG